MQCAGAAPPRAALCVGGVPLVVRIPRPEDVEELQEPVLVGIALAPPPGQCASLAASTRLYTRVMPYARAIAQVVGTRARARVGCGGRAVLTLRGVAGRLTAFPASLDSAGAVPSAAVCAAQTMSLVSCTSVPVMENELVYSVWLGTPCRAARSVLCAVLTLGGRGRSGACDADRRDLGGMRAADGDCVRARAPRGQGGGGGGRAARR